MFDKVITKFEDYVTILCFALMSIVTLVGVFCRYVLSDPLIWGEEVSRYLMIWGIFIGISIVTRKKAQLGIDVIESFAPEKFNRMMSFIANILIIVVYVILFIISINFVMDSVKLGQLTPILRIKFYYIYLAMPVGFLLCTYRSIQIFWNEFIKVSKTADEEVKEVKEEVKESEVYL